MHQRLSAVALPSARLQQLNNGLYITDSWRNSSDETLSWPLADNEVDRGVLKTERSKSSDWEYLRSCFVRHTDYVRKFSSRHGHRNVCLIPFTYSSATDLKSIVYKRHPGQMTSMSLVRTECGSLNDKQAHLQFRPKSQESWHNTGYCRWEWHSYDSRVYHQWWGEES